MSSAKTEGEKKICTSCQTPLITVKVISSWNGNKTEKPQWQNVADNKPHYYFVRKDENDKNIYRCNLPQIVEESMSEEKPKVIKKSVNTSVKLTGPFDEAELITKWATEKAYKMTMADVEDYSTLSVQEKSGLGQKQGMLTRCLADTVIELMKIHDIKSKYEEEN